MPKKNEKIVEAVIEEKENKVVNKPYFFPRAIAYIIDIVIVFLISSLIMYAVPQDKNYKTYVDEYTKLQTDYIEHNIDQDTFTSRAKSLVYDIDNSGVSASFVQTIVIILYFVVFQFYNKGQTLGKKLMKLRVVSKNGDLTLNQVAFRSLFNNSIIVNLLMIGAVLFIGRDNYYYVSLGINYFSIGLILAILLMILFKKDGRGLHDVLADTDVIQEN